MITVTVKHENGNGKESGYGVYVNAYVAWDDLDGDIPLVYASECVPFGENTEAALKKAEARVRRNANRKAKAEYEG